MSNEAAPDPRQFSRVFDLTTPPHIARARLVQVLHDDLRPARAEAVDFVMQHCACTAAEAAVAVERKFGRLIEQRADAMVAEAFARLRAEARR